MAKLNMEDDDYGQYRKAYSPLHGGPAQGPYHGTGRSAPLSTSEAYRTVDDALRAGAIRPSEAHAYFDYLKTGGMPLTHRGLSQPNYMGGLGSAGAPSPGMAAYHAHMQSLMMQQSMSMLTAGPSRPHEPTKLKSEGLHAGEIIAWRAWNIADGNLVSVVAEGKPWSATEPMKGDAAGGYGVHAYKAPHGPLLDSYVTKGSPKLWVIGEVAMWGDIIEHEDGYRSEFARVHSLVTWHEKVDGNLKLAISHKYLATQEFKLDDAA